MDYRHVHDVAHLLMSSDHGRLLDEVAKRLLTVEDDSGALRQGRSLG